MDIHRCFLQVRIGAFSHWTEFWNCWSCEKKRKKIHTIEMFWCLQVVNILWSVNDLSPVQFLVSLLVKNIIRRPKFHNVCDVCCCNNQYLILCQDKTKYLLVLHFSPHGFDTIVKVKPMPTVFLLLDGKYEYNYLLIAISTDLYFCLYTIKHTGTINKTGMVGC